MIDTSVHEDLAEIAAQVEILSETSYLFRGELRDTRTAGLAPVSETGRPVLLESGRLALLAFVESELYQRLYRRPLDGIGRSIVAGGADPAFIERLSNANTGTGSWEPGWEIIGLGADGLVGVAKGVVCWVPASDVRSTSGEIWPGGACRVRVPKEIRHLVIGYYMAIGNSEPPENNTECGGMVRLYWNLALEGAPRYICLISTLLNDLGIPFRSKVIAHPSFYQNADAGVLYFAKEDFARLREPLRQVHRDLESTLRPAVPMFTKPLAAGLGLAEDPLDGLSFGQSRCRIAAQGLWQECLVGRRSRDERLRAIVTSFQHAGLDPARPYLRASSEDIYAL